MVKVAMNNHQTASMEDYLEAIVVLRGDSRPVRVSQISRALGVKMPSVTSALKKLSDDGLVHHERYGYVGLTLQGKKVAEDVFLRHETARRFLAEILMVDPNIAEEDACKMEHVLSPDTMSRLEKFVEFVSACRQCEAVWLSGLHYYMEHGKHPPERCLVRHESECHHIETTQHGTKKGVC